MRAMRSTDKREKTGNEMTKPMRVFVINENSLCAFVDQVESEKQQARKTIIVRWKDKNKKFFVVKDKMAS